MTALALKIPRGLGKPELPRLEGPALRLAALALAAAALLAQDQLRAVALAVLADAYLQVSVFVAATLLALQALKRLTGQDLASLFERLRAWQVPAAAALGALPGCGGAVVVTTQFVQGRITFGALVAVLTATMGDAAFLLLAREPLTGLWVFALGWLVGSLSGIVIDRLHGPGFARPARAAALPRVEAGTAESAPDWLLAVWLLLLAPGLALGVLQAFQVPTESLLGVDPAPLVGVAGAALSLLLWALAPFAPEDATGCAAKRPAEAVARATAFVTLWVVAGFLAFEVGTRATGIDLGALFATWAPLVPLASILVGFLPGCGPQILVTGLYLDGQIPLSAQLGNAISNDGDALFPALALAPRAALLATLYSAVPALLVAYPVYLWLE